MPCWCEKAGQLLGQVSSIWPTTSRVIPVDSLLWKGVNCRKHRNDPTQQRCSCPSWIQVEQWLLQHFGWKNRLWKVDPFDGSQIKSGSDSIYSIDSLTHSKGACSHERHGTSVWLRHRRSQVCKLRDMEISSIKNGSKVCGRCWTCMSTWAQFFIHLLLQKNIKKWSSIHWAFGLLMNLPKKIVACSFMLFSIWDSLEFDIQKLPDMRMKSWFWSLKQNTAEEVIGRYLLK